MRKIYLFILTMAVMLIGSMTAMAAEGDRIRVDLNVDNMDWTYWNSNADKTLAWGRQAKTIDGYDIYVSAVSYQAAPDNSQSPNNMSFWDKQHLQFYALWGSRHPLSYEVNCLGGNYKIVEIGMDFVVGTHPIASPSIAEYGVSVSLAGEDPVECFSTTEPAHAEALDLDGTTTTISVDYVANEALGSSNNALFANTTSLYIIIEEVSDYEKAENALFNALDDYRAKQDALAGLVGSEPGLYSEEAYNAFNQAIDAADEMGMPGVDPTVEQLQAALKNLQDTYEAVLASKIPLKLADGYYRVHSSMEYQNNVSTGEKDENGVDITETRYMYKYLMAYESDGNIYSIWEDRDETDPYSEAMSLYKLTNKEDNNIDLVNMGTDSRFSQFAKSGYAISTTESEELLYLEPYKTEGGVTSTYIVMAKTKDAEDLVSLHQTGHSSGKGVHGYVIGWWANDGSPVEPSMWVFEPVSDEEAQRIIDAYAPVKAHNDLVKAYNAMKADAESKILTAKDYIVSEEGLVTSGDQFSSPWTSTAEGVGASNPPAWGYLLDGANNTYWHSDYSSVVPVHTHYLQVALPEAGHQMVKMKITRRPVANDHITLWGVMGSNDADAADENWTNLCQVATPYGSNTETITTNPFSIKGFQYLRFYLDDTYYSSGSRGFGHVSEFQLYEVSENPSSQFAQLGDIAKNLEAVLEKQADLESEDLTQAQYDELKAAYDAFIAEVVDPTELRELIAEWNGKEDMAVVGTDPGFWSDASAGNALKNAVAAAVEYDKAGTYIRSRSEKLAADIKSASENLLNGALGIKTGKWYKFRFATEAEYEKYGWDTVGAKASVNDYDDVIDEALFGKYITPADYSTESVKYTDLNDEGEEVTNNFTLKSVVPVVADEVALNNYLFVDDADQITSEDMVKFRFIAVGDTAYMIQNKASGLFIQATGTTGLTKLSIHPTLFNVKAIGYGENAIAATSFEGQKQNYLHVQRSYNTIVTWNAFTPGSNSGFYLEEAGDVEAGYDGSAFKMSVQPGAVNTLCYPLEVSAKEGMYAISKIEGTDIILAPITKAAAGRPFIYIEGEPEDYDEEGEGVLVELNHGYDIAVAPDTANVLIGTYVEKSLSTGDIIAQGNTFSVLKDVMQGGVAAANTAYMTPERTGLKRSDNPVIVIDMNASDGIQSAIASVAKVGTLYTIDGQLVAKKANLNTLKNMPKGMYILNGVKVAVK